MLISRHLAKATYNPVSRTSSSPPHSRRSFFSTSHKMEQLPQLDPITRLSPRLIRILGHNPGKFTLQGTNTYLVGTGSSRILLDTGEGKPEWIKSLQTALKQEGGVKISDVILTHWHHDHVSGVKDVKGLEGHEGVRVWKTSTERNPNEDGEAVIPLSGKTFTTEGATLKSVHTPGHTSDHTCFLLEEENALFTADAVLGHGTAVFEDLATYLNGLSNLLKVEAFRGKAFPGHGAVIEDGRKKVEEYISHRQQREKQIVTVLESEGKEEAWGSMDIVKVVYKDYPESLWLPAEGGVKQVLEKLKGEGRIIESNGKWRLSGKAAL